MDLDLDHAQFQLLGLIFNSEDSYYPLQFDNSYVAKNAEYLRERGYIDLDTDDDGEIIFYNGMNHLVLTVKGKVKYAAILKNKRAEKMEFIKYIITTAISLAALLLSIASLIDTLVK